MIDAEDRYHRILLDGDDYPLVGTARLLNVGTLALFGASCLVLVLFLRSSTVQREALPARKGTVATATPAAADKGELSSVGKHRAATDPGDRAAGVLRGRAMPLYLSQRGKSGRKTSLPGRRASVGRGKKSGEVSVDEMTNAVRQMQVVDTEATRGRTRKKTVDEAEDMEVEWSAPEKRPIGSVIDAFDPLSDSEVPVDGVADELAKLFQNASNLRELRLSKKRIGDDGVEALVRLLPDCTRLEFAGMDRNLIGDAGTKALAAVLPGLPILRQLRLSWNKIGEAGAEALASALPRMTCLVELNLDWNQIGESGAEALARVLPNCSSLLRLRLSWNKIGDEGAKALASVIHRCDKLRTLELDGNEIGDIGAKALAENLANHESLDVFSLNDNQIGDGGARALAVVLVRLESVRCFHLGNNLIGDIGAKALAKALPLWDAGFGDLAAERKMKEILMNLYINLRGNNIGSDGGEALAKALPHCSHLTRLELDQNHIGNPGAKALAGVIPHCKHLWVLQLSENQITVSGATALARALPGCRELRDLTLDGNQIGDSGAEALAEVLPGCKSLQRLHIDKNGIGDAGAIAFAKALPCCERDQSAPPVVKGSDVYNDIYYNEKPESWTPPPDTREGKPYLEDLSLNNNAIGHAGAEALAGAITDCDMLKRLHLSHNPIGDEGAIALGMVLHNCSALETIFLNENGIREEVVKDLNQTGKISFAPFHNYRLDLVGSYNLFDDGPYWLPEDPDKSESDPDDDGSRLGEELYQLEESIRKEAEDNMKEPLARTGVWWNTRHGDLVPPGRR